MAKTKSLADLFVNLLKDMYFAEKKIVKALPSLNVFASLDEMDEYLAEFQKRPGKS